jgi:hypothetical protein
VTFDSFLGEQSPDRNDAASFTRTQATYSITILQRETPLMFAFERRRPSLNRAELAVL